MKILVFFIFSFNCAYLYAQLDFMDSLSVEIKNIHECLLFPVESKVIIMNPFQKDFKVIDLNTFKFNPLNSNIDILESRLFSFQSNSFVFKNKNDIFYVNLNNPEKPLKKREYNKLNAVLTDKNILVYDHKFLKVFDLNFNKQKNIKIQHEFVKEQMYKYPFPYFFINYDGKYFYLHYPFSPTIFVKNENFQNIFTINNPNWGITDINLYTQQMHPNQISVRQTVNYTFNSFQYFPITIQDRYIYQLSVPNYSKEFSEQVLDLYFEDKLEPDYYLTLYNQSDYKVVFNERFKGLPHYFDGFIYEFIKKENGLWIKKYKVNLLSTK